MTGARVCVVSPLYHPSLGGLGRQAQLLTERLAEEGVEIFVIARRMKGMPQAAFSPMVKVYRAWSIKPYLHNLEGINVTNILVSLTFSTHCALLLWRNRRKYDIVHFHGASLPLFFNLPGLKLLGKKIIAKIAAARIGTEAGSLKDRYLGLGNLIIKLLHKVDAFVATTDEIEEGLHRDGFPETKIVRIPNFIDPGQFFPASGEAKQMAKKTLNLENRKVVTFSGRLVERKGMDFLIDSWGDVAKGCPDATLLVLGDGPLLKGMKERASGLGIADSVVFQGHVNRVLDFLHATDVFVLPSFQEGMPNSLLEAMASGLSVVATKIGGVVDIVKNGENGLLTEPGNARDLGEKILALLKDEELEKRLSSNALKTIESSHILDEISHEYRKLYERMLKEKRNE
jgi:glycosyltransferase involved in cell wall biosynthesis